MNKWKFVAMLNNRVTNCQQRQIQQVILTKKKKTVEGRCKKKCLNQPNLNLYEWRFYWEIKSVCGYKLGLFENNWANYQNIALSYKFYWYFHVNIKRNINNAKRANEHMFSSCAKKKTFWNQRQDCQRSRHVGRDVCKAQRLHLQCITQECVNGRWRRQHLLATPPHNIKEYGQISS